MSPVFRAAFPTILAFLSVCAAGAAQQQFVPGPPDTPVKANTPGSPGTANSVASPAEAAAPQQPAPDADPLLSRPPSEMVGDILQARGRYLASIHVYEQLPPTPQILNKLGIACEHMRMNDRARDAFQGAIKLNPKYSEAYNNLGTLAHSMSDYSLAEKMYKKALKLKPDAANTLQNLGTLYYAQHKFKKGDQVYREALKIDPDILERSAQHGIQADSKVHSASEIHYHLAATYAQAGSQKLALEYLRKAIGEGFKDRNRLMHDKEFADLRTTPLFLEMVEDLRKD